MKVVSKKSLLRAFGALALLVSASQTVCVSNTWAASEATPKEVRVAWAGGPRVWVLGKIDGSFDKALGVPVKWVEFASGADVLSLFAAREIDIARFGSSPAVAGISRKLPVEIIGLEGLIATSERLIAKKDIADLNGLEGKTVAYPPNSTAQYALEAALSLKGLDKSKIRLVGLKPADIVSAWDRGDIDAAYVWGPFSQKLESSGGHEILATRDLKKDGILVYNNFVVRKEFAEKHPDLVVAFLRTYQDKVDQYQKDPQAAVQTIAKYLALPEDTVRNTLAGIEYVSLLDQLTPAYLGDGATTPHSGVAKAAKDTAQFLVNIGELKKSDVLENYAPAINTTYLKDAVSPR